MKPPIQLISQHRNGYCNTPVSISYNIEPLDPKLHSDGSLAALMGTLSPVKGTWLPLQVVMSISHRSWLLAHTLTSVEKNWLVLITQKIVPA